MVPKHAIMERTKQKSKKDKPNKYVEKDKSSSFISDVRAFKENLKIREILRTVKMNSSMRIKAPRGSKVMQNNDFNDNEDFFEDNIVCETQNKVEVPSATNTVLNSDIDPEATTESDGPPGIEETLRDDTNVIQKSKSLSEGLDDSNNDNVAPRDTECPTPTCESGGLRPRDRKLSLDHTMLLRREGLSQSEVDLHSIGKSPLERKSSFFKKKMDSFVRNTTEIFKRQSMNSKCTRSPITSRRDSTCSRMSVSLQSLNEDSAYFNEFKDAPLDTYRDQVSSASSLQSGTPQTSTVSININDRLTEPEEDTLAGSPVQDCEKLEDTPSTSTQSLNKELKQDSLLNTRAISMSSGLDTATGQRRRKTSRSNRVSWLASESLTDYFRRLIQDEKSEEIQGWHSYQDFSAIPENRSSSKPDSKGRRLSYMRAVSGEDPALASSFRKKKIQENETPLWEIEQALAVFLRDGIPPLADYNAYQLSAEAEELMNTLNSEKAVEKYFSHKAGVLTPAEELKQEIIKELVYTEAEYIRHLKVIVHVYIAAAHALQKNSALLLELNTATLFPYIPDVLNSSMRFWDRAIYPMLRKAKEGGTLFDASLMIPGLLEFAETFSCYEDYVQSQSLATEYLRNMRLDEEFAYYVRWCNNNFSNRLQLADILVKPLQRLTKYSLLITRLSDNVDDERLRRDLLIVDQTMKAFILRVNRAVRQKEEIQKIEELKIEPYEPDFKGDEDMEKAYRNLSKVNLMQPMLECGPTPTRNLIHSGLLRYKDSLKEFDAQILLFTDMILICKKISKLKDKDKEKDKKHYSYWKLQRPKVFINRMVPHHKSNTPALIYVVLDEHGGSKAVFQLTETSKEPHPGLALKTWELKILEAIYTYTLTCWYHKHKPSNLSVIERDYNDDKMTEKESNIHPITRLDYAGAGPSTSYELASSPTAPRRPFTLTYPNYHPKDYEDIMMVDRKSRERVAAMLQTRRLLEQKEQEAETPSTYECERGPSNLHSIFELGAANYNAWQLRSFSQYHYLTQSSAGSHEDLPLHPLQRSGSFMEQGLPYWFFGEPGRLSPSITRDEDDQEAGPSVASQRTVKTPRVTVEESTPNNSPGPEKSARELSPGPRCASAGSSHRKLRVGDLFIGQSMPDINDGGRPTTPEPTVGTSIEMYRSHNDVLQRNRLAASQQSLKPGRFNVTFPPHNSRALQRGDALSYRSPLLRTKNVPDTSVDSARRILVRPSEKASGSKSPRRPRSPSPIPAPLKHPGDKTEKKKSLFIRRFEWAAHGWNGFEDLSRLQVYQSLVTAFKRSRDSNRSGSPDRHRAESDADFDTGSVIQEAAELSGAGDVRGDFPRSPQKQKERG